MPKLLSWLVNLVPEQYRVSVAIKKASYMVAKLATSFITARLLTTGKLNAEQCSQIELAITTVMAGGLEAVHDWAKLKWPNTAWL